MFLFFTLRTSLNIAKVGKGKLISSNKNDNKIILFALLPFVNGDWFKMPETMSSYNKVILGMLILSSVLLYCIMNVIFYFACLYIIQHTELEKKYPKLNKVINQSIPVAFS